MNKIRLWWKFDGRYMHRDFIHGVKNLFYWFSIIWKDRNWDHSFILQMLAHKLKAQAKYIGDRNFHTTAKRDAEIMLTCVRLIEKLDSGYYELEYFDYHESDLRFEPTCESSDLIEVKINQISEKLDEYFAKYPLIYKRVMNGEGWLKIEDKNDKHRIASCISHMNHDRAKKLLFKLMERNIEGWWD